MFFVFNWIALQCYIKVASLYNAIPLLTNVFKLKEEQQHSPSTWAYKERAIITDVNSSERYEVLVNVHIIQYSLSQANYIFKQHHIYF